jgi:hypothetical protein
MPWNTQFVATLQPWRDGLQGPTADDLVIRASLPPSLRRELSGLQSRLWAQQIELKADVADWR